MGAWEKSLEKKLICTHLVLSFIIWSPDLHLSRESQWWKWQKNIFRTLHHHPVQNAQICHLLLNRLFYKLYPNALGSVLPMHWTLLQHFASPWQPHLLSWSSRETICCYPVIWPLQASILLIVFLIRNGARISILLKIVNQLRVNLHL